MRTSLWGLHSNEVYKTIFGFFFTSKRFVSHYFRWSVSCRERNLYLRQILVCGVRLCLPIRRSRDKSMIYIILLLNLFFEELCWSCVFSFFVSRWVGGKVTKNYKKCFINVIVSLSSISRFSSAGRASDWRSEGPVFDPRRWHVFFVYLQCFNGFLVLSGVLRFLRFSIFRIIELSGSPIAR